MHMDGGLPRGWSWRFTEDRGRNFEFKQNYLIFRTIEVVACCFTSS